MKETGDRRQGPLHSVIFQEGTIGILIYIIGLDKIIIDELSRD